MIQPTTDKTIKNIAEIQNKWAEGVIKIGLDFKEGKDYVSTAEIFLNSLYNFECSKVLFKPTKAKLTQFRAKKNEFMSYFIGHHKVCKEDKGFALEPWKEINFKNFDILSLDKIIISMGNYFFTNYKNHTLKVEYSFGYIFDKNKNLKIIFHHSSIPFKST